MSNRDPAFRELPAQLEPLIVLARDALGDMAPEQRSRGEAALEKRIARARAARPVRLATAFAVAASVVLASTVAWKFGSRSSSDLLSYVVEGAHAPADGSLDVESGPARVVRFSDGTEVRVEQGTQARVRFVTNHGAALAMARGALHAAVVHSSVSEWRFDAGPYVVHVTGTEFGLSWDPDRDRFDLRMEHGSVTVTSPVANDPIPVRAGQWLTIRARSNEVFIRDLTGPSEESQAHALPADAPIPVPEPSDRATNDADTPNLPRAADSGHHWAQDLAHGKLDEIVSDALHRGLDGCLAEASSSELSALADAARYTRRDDVARKALLAERRRFAGSRSAVTAGLLLGRLAEAEHDDTQALTWFNTYLAEAPAGPYASEALGRKMALVRHSIGPDAARAVAQEYLAKYANGTYSSAARAILKNP